MPKRSQVLIPPDGNPESCRFGMDNRTNAKQLRRDKHQLMRNVVPDIVGKPRNGFNEKVVKTNAIGYDSSQVYFRPHAIHVLAGGDDWFFIWHKNASYPNEFGLEAWNLTDSTREILFYGDFGNSDVHISMQKLYDAVYVTMDYDMDTARENTYRTRNKIIKWNSTSSSWDILEYGIDLNPSIATPTVADAASAGISQNKYVDIAFTFVRRTDDNSKLASIAAYGFDSWEDIGGTQYVGKDEKLLTGTVSCTGDTTLTGSGSAFETELSVDDYVRVDGGSTAYKVTAIASDTSATIENAGGDSFSAKQFSLLPAVGDPITTDTWHESDQEGADLIASRENVQVSSTGSYGRLLMTAPDDSQINDAVAQGATHLREYRTEEFDKSDAAAGGTHYYVQDIAIKGDSYYTNKKFIDSVSNTTIQGTDYYLQSTAYTVPPQGRYFDYDVRAWVGGNPGNKGYWFYSEEPLNVQYPQKFASWFKPANKYWVACDPQDGQYDTGTALLAGDRYFFKESKIFRLASADPAKNTAKRIYATIGNTCPESLTRLFLPGRGECLGFISDFGPTILMPGGKIEILADFAIASLFPDGDGVLRQSDGSVTDWYSRNSVSGRFWNNTWWILYGDSRDSNSQLDENKVYGYHWEPDEDAIGAFEVQVAQLSGNNSVEPIVLVPVDNNRAYCFSHGQVAIDTVTDNDGDLVTDNDGNVLTVTDTSATKYRLMQFLDSTVYRDTFISEGALPYDMVLETAYRFVGPRMIVTGEVNLLNVYMKYSDSGDLTVTVTSDDGRWVATKTYSQQRQSGLASDNTVRDSVAVTIPEGFLGRKFKAKIEKEVPADGDIEYFGIDMEGGYVDMPDEFSDGPATLTAGSGGFVEEADADSENIISTT